MMRGVCNRTLYNLLGRIDNGKCSNVICLASDRTSTCLVELTILWHKQIGLIGEKGLHAMHIKV